MYGGYSGGMYGGYGTGGMYGRGMYGRSSMWGRGAYGRSSMYGSSAYDQGAMPPPEGVLGRVQQTLHGLGQFSQLLDGSFFSMNESFMSLMDFLNVMGELRQHLYFIVKALTALALLQVTGRSVKEFFMGRSRDADDLASFHDYQGQRSPRRSIWPKVLLVAGLVALFGPWLLNRILQALGLKGMGSKVPKLPPRKVVVVYDYRAESNEELPLRTGDLIIVEDDRSNQEWWRGRDESGRVGFFPANFVETLIDEDAASEEQGAAEDANAVPLTPEQKAERKRRMDVVRERRRRDRDATALSSPQMRSRGPRVTELSHDDLQDDMLEPTRRLSYSSGVY